MSSWDTVNSLEKLTEGSMLILIDDSKPLGEAAFICLAKYTTPEVVNCMVTYAKGMLSISMTEQMAEQAGLFPQARNGNKDQTVRNYTISIDADETTTGISAQERSLSIKKLEQTRTIEGFKKPGHIFPIISNKRGLYDCTSVIEGAADCAKILGLHDGMVTVCDIMDEDGMMGDTSYALQLAQRLQLSVVYLSDLLKYKLIKDGLISSKNTLNILIDGCSIRMCIYELIGQNYEVCFSTLELEKVKQKLVRTQKWLNENPYDSINKLQNFQSSFSKVARQFQSNEHLVVHGEQEPSNTFCTHMIFELIFNDLEDELEALMIETSKQVKAV
jgi:3,4-dihydroxy-2-butanone 4-phosphate synthase